jgi:hypothetical protein
LSINYGKTAPTVVVVKTFKNGDVFGLLFMKSLALNVFSTDEMTAENELKRLSSI